MPMFESGRQPIGAVTGEAYQGINGMLLSMGGHNDPRWITRTQAESQNLFVKKGEKSSRILKQTWTKSLAKIDPATGYPERDFRGNVKTQTVRLQNPTANLVPVFNVSQMQDVPPLGHKPQQWDPLQRAEEVLKNSGIVVKHDQREGEHYNPRLHEIHLKPESAYESKEQYLEAGMYQLVQGMARENEIRTRNVGDEDKSVRDDMAFARAHAVLCSGIGIKANTDRQLEKTQEFITALEDNPYAIMEASKLATEIVKEVQTREMRRVPERTAEVAAERDSMVYASPRVEIENHRTMQRVLTALENNPDNVFTFQYDGQELFARKGSEKLYSKPDETPQINDVFDMKHQVAAFNRDGEMFDVIMTNTFVQLENGRSEQLETNRKPVVTDLNRSTMFPPDWTGELKVEPAVLGEDHLPILGVPSQNAEVHVVCAVRNDGELKPVKTFDSPDAAKEFAAIYENEHDRQNGKFKEKPLEGVTFFKVDFDPAERKVAVDMGLEYYGQVKSWGAPPGLDLAPIHNRFDEHDPYQRLAEMEARKAERAAGIGVTVIDVPPGRAEEAVFLGAKYSQKHEHFYIPDNINPEPLLGRFEQLPAIVSQDASVSDKFTVPYPERAEAAEMGIVYNSDGDGG